MLQAHATSKDESLGVTAQRRSRCARREALLRTKKVPKYG